MDDDHMSYTMPQDRLTLDVSTSAIEEMISYVGYLKFYE